MSKSKTKHIKSNEILENIIYFLEEIKGDTLYRTALFLKNRNITFENIIGYLKDPQHYPGSKFRIQNIVLKFLDDAIVERYQEIQKLQLTIKLVQKAVFDLLFKPKVRGENYN